MSFYDRLAGQDTAQLLPIAASLSLVTASSSRFSYNFALMLFGIVAHDLTSTAPFRHFLVLTLVTAIFDILALLSGAGGGALVSICATLVLILKAPIFIAGLVRLRERGGDIQIPGPWGGGGGGWSAPNMPSMPSMPSSFAAPPSAPSPPGTFPSTGGFRLGGDEENQQQPPPQTTRGGYQTIA